MQHKLILAAMAACMVLFLSLNVAFAGGACINSGECKCQVSGVFGQCVTCEKADEDGNFGHSMMVCSGGLTYDEKSTLACNRSQCICNGKPATCSESCGSSSQSLMGAKCQGGNATEGNSGGSQFNGMTYPPKK